MDEREIIPTEHAAKEMYRLNLGPTDLEKIIREGERIPEGENKARYRLRTKKGLLIAICGEYSDQIRVITIEKGSRRR